MVNDNKLKIIELREKGYGYKKIAKELGISVGSVRHACEQAEANITKEHCLYCGKEMTSIPGKKRKRFCSDKCRYDYWNKQKKEAKHGN